MVLDPENDEIDHELWSTNSDIEHLQQIQENATLGPAIDDLAEGPARSSIGRMGSGGFGGGGGLSGGHKVMFVENMANSLMAKDKKHAVNVTTEAVMKIVDNIDSNAISAHAMEMTQVGFIDALRNVQADKFKTLKEVKNHFIDKLNKVVQAKDYQIKCQRLIST